ncbi:substrate-binding domain-containing protein [bacterium]|nr:substrate-binding domain-containing protein [bacterium]
MKKIIVSGVLGLLIILLTVKYGRRNTVKMATTTSVENSGLLDVLIPAFEKDTGIRIHAVACGTGKALKHAENGDVDIVLTHAPVMEKKFIERGFGVNRTEILWNDFILAGTEDTVKTFNNFKSVSQVFAKIAEDKLLFVSRGDNSGTHVKEMGIWSKAGIAPQGKWYMETGQGMGATLTIADEKRGCCLVDRGTFISFKSKIGLVSVFEDTVNLKNIYSVMMVNPARHPHVKRAEAEVFIEWISSGNGRKKAAEFKKNGKILFEPL